MAENIDLQISALKRLWTRQLGMSPAKITKAQLLEIATGAGAVMVDGSEVIRVSFTEGGADGMVLYPKYVAMTAALDLLDVIDPIEAAAAPDSSVVQCDLSRTPVET